MIMDIIIVVVLVLLATALLTVEVALIPGFGFTGILGVMALIASVFYAFYTIGYIAGWITVLAAVFICIALFLWALYGKSLDRLALKKNIDSTVKGDEAKKFKVGDRGFAKTRLALIGEANFGGTIVEVKSEVGFINENEEIEIIRISGDAIFVEKVNKD